MINRDEKDQLKPREAESGMGGALSDLDELRVGAPERFSDKPIAEPDHNELPDERRILIKELRIRHSAESKAQDGALRDFVDAYLTDEELQRRLNLKNTSAYLDGQSESLDYPDLSPDAPTTREDTRRDGRKRSDR